MFRAGISIAGSAAVFALTGPASAYDFGEKAVATVNRVQDYVLRAGDDLA